MDDPLKMKDIELGGTVEDWKAAEADERNWGGFWVTLKGGPFFMGNVPRSAASYYMRSWWAAREAARNPEHPQHESSLEWLKNGTLAINRVPKDGEKDWCESAVAVSEIVGMRFHDDGVKMDAIVGQAARLAEQCERLEKILKELSGDKGGQTMRIAVISSQVFPCPPRGYAGLEMIAYHTAKGLAKLGHSVTLIAPEGSRCEGCDLFHTGPPDGNEHRAYDAYWKHLPGYECVIDHSWQKWPLQLKAEGRLPQPVLCVLHAPVNTMMQSPPQVPNPCVVCISEDQASHYRALFGRDCRVAYNGVDVKYYRPMTVRRTDRFLFLARFSRIKGADIAIRACLDAGVGLDLVGDTSITNEPDYLRECYSLAAKTSPGWDVSMRGRQIAIHGGATRGECVRWFSQAHALLHPVKDFREPFGMAPVEAQLCDCPVIAWDNGAMRETVKHGETGILVRSSEELTGVVKDVSHTGLGRSACRPHAAKFSLENMALRYQELAHEAVNTGGW